MNNTPKMVYRSTITHEGVVLLTKSGEGWIFKTVWNKADFDDDILKILEVVDKHVK